MYSLRQKATFKMLFKKTVYKLNSQHILLLLSN